MFLVKLLTAIAICVVLVGGYIALDRNRLSVSASADGTVAAILDKKTGKVTWVSHHRVIGVTNINDPVNPYTLTDTRR